MVLIVQHFVGRRALSLVEQSQPRDQRYICTASAGIVVSMGQLCHGPHKDGRCVSAFVLALHAGSAAARACWLSAVALKRLRKSPVPCGDSSH